MKVYLKLAQKKINVLQDVTVVNKNIVFEKSFTSVSGIQGQIKLNREGNGEKEKSNRLSDKKIENETNIKVKRPLDDVLGDILYSPKQSFNENKKKTRVKLPYVLTSEKWIEMEETREKEKLEKEEQKLIRKKQREEKKENKKPKNISSEKTRKPKSSEELKRSVEPSEREITHDTSDQINCHSTNEPFAIGDFVLVEFVYDKNTKKETKKKLSPKLLKFQRMNPK